MNPRSRVPPLAWWIIWGTLLSGVILMDQFVEIPSVGPLSNGADSPLWLAAVFPLAASAIIRWLVLPRFTSAAAAMPLFIIGMATAESTFLLGMFLFPEHKRELLILALLGIFQFAPYFASRYQDDGNR